MKYDAMLNFSVGAPIKKRFHDFCIANNQDLIEVASVFIIFKNFQVSIAVLLQILRSIVAELINSGVLLTNGYTIYTVTLTNLNL